MTKSNSFLSKQLAALMALVCIAFAAPAAALAGGDGAGYTHTHNYNYSYSELRDAPNGGLVIANLYNDSAVGMQCWVDAAPSATGNYSSQRWFRVSAGSQTGYVHSSYVFDQVSVPAC